MKWLKLMRVHHYLKNFLIFVPLACSGNIFKKDLFVRNSWGFIIFCMMSSIIYIVNGIMDCDKDKKKTPRCQHLQRGVFWFMREISLK